MPSSSARIVIVGAGPAGIAAAVQLKRYGLEPIMLERESVGGLLRNANWVENYPGFPNGVVGSKLIGLMKKQLERIGVPVCREEVLAVDLVDEEFFIVTAQATRTTDFLVIASGTKSRDVPPFVLGEARERVFTEVWPLLDQEQKHIVIVGAGDAAFDYALNLSKKRNIVTILNRGESVKCLRLLWERAALEPAISYRARVAVRRVEVDGAATRLEIRCEADSSFEKIDADYVLFAIGRRPQLDSYPGI
jgi:thioredoxin reductase